MKPTRGGKRPGSGRKPGTAPRKVTRSVNLSPDAWKRLDKAANRRKMSASAVVSEWAETL